MKLSNPTSLAILVAFMPLTARSQTPQTEADAIGATKGGESAVIINGDNAAFAYEMKTEISTPKESLAKILSSDYRDAPDEFTAKELFGKLEPVIDKRLAEAKKTKLWSVDIRAQLSEYDFKTSGFPTNLAASTFLTYDPNYAVRFSNSPEFGSLPVALDEAKHLANKLQKDRTINLIVEGAITEAKEQTLNRYARKVIIMKISRITMKLTDETVIGSFGK